MRRTPSSGGALEGAAASLFTAIREARRRGIALPMVLMIVVFLTISIGAGFLLAGVEHQVSADHDAQLKAYAVAQEGVERYLTDVTTLPASFPDVRTIQVNGGTATVTMRRVRAGGADQAIYAITSVGNATAPDLRRSASTPVAERTISQLVMWQETSLGVIAAWTSLSGVQKNGNSGTVSGVNASDPATGCAGGGGPVAGIAVPDSIFTQNGGSSGWIDGNPDNAPAYVGTPGPSGTAVDSVGLNWAAMLAGSIAPDFTINRLVTPNTGAWPTAAQYNNWPVVLVKGNVTGGDVITGQGVLLVTGNANMSNFTWHGLVLVGGTVTLNGSAAALWGAVISGLNEQLGVAVPPTSIGNGNVLVQYNSCDVDKALYAFGGWRRIQNTWADNWPSYAVP